MFNCSRGNIKENELQLKLVRNLYIFKLFDFYIEKLK